MNTKFFIDAINKPFVRYSVLHGTKYRLNRCGLLVAGTGALAGVGVYAMADKPVKRYLIPSAVAVGSASMLLLLTVNNYSLKNKIAMRGVEHVKGLITKQVACDLRKKNELYKATISYIKSIDYLNTPQFLDNSNNDLSIITKRIGDIHSVICLNKQFIININELFYTNNFQELAILLNSLVNNMFNEKITAIKIGKTENNGFNVLEYYNQELDYYTEVFIYTKIFLYQCIYIPQNNIDNYEKFIKKLSPIYFRAEYIDYIKDIASKLMELNVLDKRVNTHESLTQAINIIPLLISIYSAGDAIKYRDDIEQLSSRYNLQINYNGKIEFLDQDKLINCLPK